ncbi:hypothetical protein FA95DRAFT_1570804 [Auriscalpium vulgare]|uniref:Uncharacterized protein n=1 Tax=Auriscalpium vulgare TaxID=40419 RepID=A0ACB8S2A6_9AGAM|nr:hypothetical protein FA95DRAFT_1570804 [Auriscalpium vulgare]
MARADTSRRRHLPRKASSGKARSVVYTSGSPLTASAPASPASSEASKTKVASDRLKAVCREVGETTMPRTPTCNICEREMQLKVGYFGDAAGRWTAHRRPSAEQRSMMAAIQLQDVFDEQDAKGAAAAAKKADRAREAAKKAANKVREKRTRAVRGEIKRLVKRRDSATARAEKAAERRRLRAAKEEEAMRKRESNAAEAQRKREDKEIAKVEKRYEVGLAKLAEITEGIASLRRQGQAFHPAAEKARSKVQKTISADEAKEAGVKLQNAEIRRELRKLRCSRNLRELRAAGKANAQALREAATHTNQEGDDSDGVVSVQDSDDSDDSDHADRGVGAGISASAPPKMVTQPWLRPTKSRVLQAVDAADVLGLGKAWASKRKHAAAASSSTASSSSKKLRAADDMDVIELD